MKTVLLNTKGEEEDLRLAVTPPANDVFKLTPQPFLRKSVAPLDQTDNNEDHPVIRFNLPMTPHAVLKSGGVSPVKDGTRSSITFQKEQESEKTSIAGFS